jgi:hypothetical protein
MPYKFSEFTTLSEIIAATKMREHSVRRAFKRLGITPIGSIGITRIYAPDVPARVIAERRQREAG